jgi:hypothetical protein
MGLSTALYRSLLSIDTVDFLLSSQCICFAFWLSCFLLVLMCFDRVSLQLRWMPRYFTSFLWSRSTLAICTVGQVWLVFIHISEIYVLENCVSTFVMRMSEDIDVCCAWGDY